MSITDWRWNDSMYHLWGLVPLKGEWHRESLNLKNLLFLQRKLSWKMRHSLFQHLTWQKLVYYQHKLFPIINFSHAKPRIFLGKLKNLLFDTPKQRSGLKLWRGLNVFDQWNNRLQYPFLGYWKHMGPLSWVNDDLDILW